MVAEAPTTPQIPQNVLTSKLIKWAQLFPTLTSTIKEPPKVFRNQGALCLGLCSSKPIQSSENGCALTGCRSSLTSLIKNSSNWGSTSLNLMMTVQVFYLLSYARCLIGSIGLEELEQPLISLGLCKTREEVQQIMNEVDEDGSG